MTRPPFRPAEPDDPDRNVPAHGAGETIYHETPWPSDLHINRGTPHFDALTFGAEKVLQSRAEADADPESILWSERSSFAYRTMTRRQRLALWSRAWLPWVLAFAALGLLTLALWPD